MATVAFLIAQPVSAGFIFFYSDPSGLAAEAEFTLLNPTTLEIRLRNTSTGVPLGFDNADQILTGVSWDFGSPGINVGDVMILGGSVVIGPGSASVDFDAGSFGPGADVSGEWGFSNQDGTGMLTNFISGNAAQATPFGGPNLDGPDNIDGPQGGLISSAFFLPLGGLGAIQDEIIATLTLSAAMTDAQLLADLNSNSTVVEFGSDAAFLTGVPAPGALGLLAVAAIARRRRRCA